MLIALDSIPGYGFRIPLVRIVTIDVGLYHAIDIIDCRQLGFRTIGTCHDEAAGSGPFISIMQDERLYRGKRDIAKIRMVVSKLLTIITISFKYTVRSLNGSLALPGSGMLEIIFSPLASFRTSG